MTAFDTVQASFPSLFPDTAEIACGQGWAEIVRRLLADIESVPPLAEVSDFRILAVRQKLGRLRIETAYADRFADGLMPSLLLAEFRSMVTCEQCGKAGHMRKTEGVLRVRCDEHSTPEEREQLPRPSWVIGRATRKGYLWYDPEADTVKIVDDLASIGVPPDRAEQIEATYREVDAAAARWGLAGRKESEDQ